MLSHNVALLHTTGIQNTTGIPNIKGILTTLNVARIGSAGVFCPDSICTHLEYFLLAYANNIFEIKNPAYGRQSISPPIRIVAPIPQ